MTCLSGELSKRKAQSSRPASEASEQARLGVDCPRPLFPGRLGDPWGGGRIQSQQVEVSWDRNRKKKGGEEKGGNLQAEHSPQPLLHGSSLSGRPPSFRRLTPSPPQGRLFSHPFSLSTRASLAPGFPERSVHQNPVSKSLSTGDRMRLVPKILVFFFSMRLKGPPLHNTHTLLRNKVSVMAFLHMHLSSCPYLSRYKGKECVVNSSLGLGFHAELEFRESEGDFMHQRQDRGLRCFGLGPLSPQQRGS